MTTRHPPVQPGAVPAVLHRTTGAGGEGDADIRQKNASNESRISFGEQEDRVSGMGGVYYARTRTDETLHLRGLSAFDDTKKNLGVRRAELPPERPLTLTTGLRYQEDRIERSGNSVLAPRPLDYQKTFSAFLPKVSWPSPRPRTGPSAAWSAAATTLAACRSTRLPQLGLLQGRNHLELRTVHPRQPARRPPAAERQPVLHGFQGRPVQHPGGGFAGVAQSYTINAEKAHAYGMELDLDYRLRATTCG